MAVFMIVLSPLVVNVLPTSELPKSGAFQGDASRASKEGEAHLKTILREEDRYFGSFS
jgi:hypothetical protein